MKTLQKTLLALAATSVMAMSANATISYGSSAASSQPYVGVQIGQADIDGLDKKATTYGVYGGYNFDHQLGIEGEFIKSDKTEINSAVTGELQSYGVYGTYRWNFNNTPVYAKGKLGVAKTELEIANTSGSFRSTNDVTGLAGGIGIGYKPTGNIGIEAGYNYLSSDAKNLSLGAHFTF